VRKPRTASAAVLTALLWAAGALNGPVAQAGLVPDKPLRLQVEQFGRLRGDGSVDLTFRRTCPTGAGWIRLWVGLDQVVSGLVVNGDDHDVFPCSSTEKTTVMRASIWRWGGGPVGQRFDIGPALVKYHFAWCADLDSGESCSMGVERSETIFVRR
jgi:hypothetical protein